jgi:hypothetical protein
MSTAINADLPIVNNDGVITTNSHVNDVNDDDDDDDDDTPHSGRRRDTIISFMSTSSAELRLGVERAEKKLIYKIDDNPPIHMAFLFAMQVRAVWDHIIINIIIQGEKITT